MRPPPPFRAATPDDAMALAELVNMASEGLTYHLWGKMVEPGESPWDVGQRRARREEASFSYRNAILLEEGGQVVAWLIGYRLQDTPEPIDPAATPPMFVALQELENLVPGTWYVNVLATYPTHRGKGHGARLLRAADLIASDAGCRGLSIIVSNANAVARRLYERNGYRTRAERPILKDEGWKNPGTAWVLLVKDL
jgi:ribosomal protein S18 acetylase RimI-like enzyme